MRASSMPFTAERPISVRGMALRLREAQVLIEQWRKHYNTIRPHSALGYRPPVPETIVQMDQRPLMH